MGCWVLGEAGSDREELEKNDPSDISPTLTPRPTFTPTPKPRKIPSPTPEIVPKEAKAKENFILLTPEMFSGYHAFGSEGDNGSLIDYLA